MPLDNQNMIELRNLSKSYTLPGNVQIPALKNINLTVKRGEIFGIIGESGAGKSTLIRSVNLLEPPSSGQVWVDDQDLTQLKPPALRHARQKIGMIFQHFNLLNSRTVYENIAFPLELVGFSKSAIAKKVNPLLELTGLSTRKKYYPRQLSGGQKQRVAILITHEMQVIKQICHQVAILENGHIAEQADILSFFSHNKSPIATRFIRAQAIHDLPKVLQQRIVTTQIDAGLPLWQLSFFGKAAEQPLITQLISTFGLSINILQAHMETISDEIIGVMLIEVTGSQEQLERAKTFLATQKVYVETIGYVTPAI